jgi:hypothetical protein
MPGSTDSCIGGVYKFYKGAYKKIGKFMRNNMTMQGKMVFYRTYNKRARILVNIYSQESELQWNQKAGFFGY